MHVWAILVSLGRILLIVRVNVASHCCGSGFFMSKIGGLPGSSIPGSIQFGENFLPADRMHLTTNLRRILYRKIVVGWLVAHCF
jgi:hypothetical protein